MSRTPIVVCHRDPDSSNEFHTFGPKVRIVDIDYGYADLSDREEFEDWVGGLEGTVADLRKIGTFNALNAALHIEGAIGEARVNYGHAD